MKAGAFDFLEKPVDNHRFVDRVEAALALDRDTAQLRALQSKVSAAASSLTPREREVLEMMMEGWTTKDIADELQLSVKTIEVHRHNVMQKTGAHSLPSLMQMLYASGVVKPRLPDA
jgi:two-component system response regulator FixJ